MDDADKRRWSISRYKGRSTDGCKISGWLFVYEFEVEQKSHGAGSRQTNIHWHRRFCVFRPDEQSFVCFTTEQAGNRVGRHLQNIRLDDGVRPFYRDVDYFDKFRRHFGGKEHRVDMICETMSEHYCDFEENSVYGCYSSYTPMKNHKKVQFDVYSLHESLYSSVGDYHCCADTPYELVDTCSTSALTENSPFSDIYSLNPACLRRDPLQQHHRYGRIYSETPFVPPTSIDEDIMPAEAYLGYVSYTNGQRGSLPNSASHLSSPSSSRFVNFFARPFRSNPLKRTKSVSKLERIKRSALDKEGWSFNTPSTCPPTTSTNFMPCRQAPAERRPQQLFNNGSSSTTKNRARPSPSNIRNTRSHESLLTYSTSATHAIDLSNRNCTVTPLHSSLLGSAHCFQIKTGTGATKYYACRTAMERNRWMESLRIMQPDHDQVVRQERSLKIWIFAAKGLQCKKRYYCEMYLDKNLYCRTTSKLKMNDECFWGEQFEITHLPKVETFSINLYKENDRKKRKEYKTNLIGVVQIPVSYLVVRHPIEKWYTVISNAEKSSKIDSSSSLRVKARYQVVTIMPLRGYDGLVQFIKNNYLLLCSAVEHVTSVKSKEDIATCLVHILHKLRLSKEFLCDLVVSEVESLDNYHLMFRGNSLATKAMEAYMKLVGEQYLHDTLAEFVQNVVEYEEDCEVDTCKVSNYAYLIRQRENLFQLVQSAWGKIVNSSYYFPTELRIVFNELRNRLSLCHRSDLADYLISSNIFLRFLCPAILSPSLFDLIQEYPNEKTVRTLTLIAKTVQTLANFTKFGVKEHYMEFMNTFVEGEFDHMRQYLMRISGSQIESQIHKAIEWECCVDLGKQLALLHSYLVESWPHINDKLQDKSSSLKYCLDTMSANLDDLSKAQASFNISKTDSPTSPLSDYENNNLSSTHSTLSSTNTNDKKHSSTNEAPSLIMEDVEGRIDSPSNKSRSSSDSGRSSITPHFNLPKTRDDTINNNVRTKIIEENFLNSCSSGLVAKRLNAAHDLHTDDDYVWQSALDGSMELRIAVCNRENAIVAKRDEEVQTLNNDSHSVKSSESHLSPASSAAVTAASAVVGTLTDGFSFADENLATTAIPLVNLSNVNVDATSSETATLVVDQLNSSHNSLNQAASSSSGYHSLTYSTSNSSSPVETLKNNDDENKKSTVAKACCSKNGCELAIENPLYSLQTVPLANHKVKGRKFCRSLPDMQLKNGGICGKFTASSSSKMLEFTTPDGSHLSDGKKNQPVHSNDDIWRQQESRFQLPSQPPSTPRRCTNPQDVCPTRLLSAAVSLPPLSLDERNMRRTKTELDIFHPFDSQNLRIPKLSLASDDRERLYRTKNSTQSKSRSKLACQESSSSQPILEYRLQIVQSELEKELSNRMKKEQIIERQRKCIEMLQSQNQNLLSTLNNLQNRTKSIIIGVENNYRDSDKKSDDSTSSLDLEKDLNEKLEENTEKNSNNGLKITEC